MGYGVLPSIPLDIPLISLRRRRNQFRQSQLNQPVAAGGDAVHGLRRAAHGADPQLPGRRREGGHRG